MPLNAKGRKIKRAMDETYKNEPEGTAERVFFASQNSGKIKDVEAKKRRHAKQS